jgi:hypothetical protein
MGSRSSCAGDTSSGNRVSTDARAAMRSARRNGCARHRMGAARALRAPACCRMSTEQRMRASGEHAGAQMPQQEMASSQVNAACARAGARIAPCARAACTHRAVRLRRGGAERHEKHKRPRQQRGSAAGTTDTHAVACAAASRANGCCVRLGRGAASRACEGARAFGGWRRVPSWHTGSPRAHPPFLSRLGMPGWQCFLLSRPLALFSGRRGRCAAARGALHGV